MKKSIRTALSFLAVAGIAGGVAATAQAGQRGAGMRGDPSARFERVDVDDSGDITFEEFSAAIGSRVSEADKDGDGKMTVGEIAAEIQRLRDERMARRLVERFDADGDGAVTKAEIEQRQKKLFALLDRNDDGKIEADEMGRRGQGKRGAAFD